jgi:hypothetical protein
MLKQQNRTKNSAPDRQSNPSQESLIESLDMADLLFPEVPKPQDKTNFVPDTIFGIPIQHRRNPGRFDRPQAAVGEVPPVQKVLMDLNPAVQEREQSDKNPGPKPAEPTHGGMVEGVNRSPIRGVWNWVRGFGAEKQSANR